LSNEFEKTIKDIEVYTTKDRYFRGWLMGESVQSLNRNSEKPFVELFSQLFANRKCDLLWDKVMACCESTEENVSEFIIYPGRSPLSILFLGLGPTLATSLPGILGNFVLGKEQLLIWYNEHMDKFVSFIESKSYNANLQTCFEGVICPDTSTNQDKIDAIFTAFLHAFRDAIDKKAGLISLSIPSR
jgi:hypothetical protein